MRKAFFSKERVMPKFFSGLMRYKSVNCNPIWIILPWLYIFLDLASLNPLRNRLACECAGSKPVKSFSSVASNSSNTSPGKEYECGLKKLRECYSGDRSFEHVLSLSTTDKKDHHYGHMYAPIFNPLKYEKISFMEIGLRKGASLKVWKEFFPNAKIYGIDKGKIFTEFKSEASGDRVKIFIGDQSHVPFLRKISKIINSENGQLDFIIDDGGHTMKQQITSFTHLMPLVKPGGYYFIEDLETSYYGKPCRFGCYGQCCGGGPPGKKGTTIDLIKSFIDVLNQDFVLKINSRMKIGVGNYSVNPSDYMVGSIQCWRNMCAIKKKQAGSYF